MDQCDDELLLNPLLDGIQHRLQNPNIPIRRMGMRVAEQMSHLLSPEKPLEFKDCELEMDEVSQKRGLDWSDRLEENSRPRSASSDEPIEAENKPKRSRIPEKVWISNDDSNAEDEEDLEPLGSAEEVISVISSYCRRIHNYYLPTHLHPTSPSPSPCLLIVSSCSRNLARTET